MFIAMKNATIKYNDNYYRLKEGAFVENLPKKLENKLVKNKYIIELVVCDDDDLLPEEELNLQEIEDVDLDEELVENKHKIGEEGIFNL